MVAFSRKRQPDETREDFARVSEIKKEIRTRKECGVEPFIHDEFSLAAASILRFNRELALKPIEERRKVMNALRASDEDLLYRIRTFNRGTSENLLYLPPSIYVLYIMYPPSMFLMQYLEYGGTHLDLSCIVPVLLKIWYLNSIWPSFFGWIRWFLQID
jgi:hypothetical protein